MAEILQYETLIERILRETGQLAPGQRARVYSKARLLVSRTFIGAHKAQLRRNEMNKLEIAIVKVEERLDGDADHLAALPPVRIHPPKSSEKGSSPPRPSAMLASAPTERKAAPSLRLGSPHVVVIGAILMTAACVAGFMAMRPDLDKPGQTQLMAAQASTLAPSSALPMTYTQWRARQTGGAVAWTHELDRSSLASRRFQRTILTGRFSLAPLSGDVSIYVVPVTQEGIRATHLLEMAFEPGGEKSVRLVEAVQFGPDRSDADGVIIRTSPNSFAYAFNAGAGTLANRRLVQDARELHLALRLETGETLPVSIGLVPLLE